MRRADLILVLKDGVIAAISQSDFVKPRWAVTLVAFITRAM